MAWCDAVEMLPGASGARSSAGELLRGASRAWSNAVEVLARASGAWSGAVGMLPGASGARSGAGVVLAGALRVGSGAEGVLGERRERGWVCALGASQLPGGEERWHLCVLAANGLDQSLAEVCRRHDAAEDGSSELPSRE